MYYKISDFEIPCFRYFLKQREAEVYLFIIMNHFNKNHLSKIFLKETT